VDQDGRESAFCDRGDGLGIGLLREAGGEVIVLSKEPNPVVTARCRKLRIEAVQGLDDKLPVLRRLAGERGLDPAQVAYVGNDINDLECLRWVGVPIAVADAQPEVLAAVKWVTSKPGGRGAVREVTDEILAARRRRAPAVRTEEV
jgi:N-acylneuraminate cytidylyltransferase